jgi:Flp pilus assembly protein TadG
MSLRRFRARLSNERGAVLALFAISIGTFVLFIAFVVDAANWYEHKRHLQLQADAAALAGAQSFSLASCSNTNIAAAARRYGGSDSPDGTTVRTQPYNDQVGGTPATKMHILINSSGYYGDTGAGDNTDSNGGPCAAGYVDIKATETSLPWFFGGSFVPKINAHARVSLVQESQANGTLPIAVPNPLPTSAAAIFVDETNGSVVATAPLSEVGVSGSLDMWQSNTTTPVAVTIPSRATGVVIALSGKQSMSLSGGLTAICDQALTDCYDSSTDPPTNGVSFIRGYDTGGNGTQPNPPKLRSVELFPINCPNSAYFSNNTSTCNYELAARIDAQMPDGSNMPNANQIYTANGIQLDSSTDTNCASVAGAGKCWHTPSTSPLTLPARSGPNNVTMSWAETIGCLVSAPCGTHSSTDCTTTGGNKCKGNFESGAVIQRAYSAVTATTGPSSGPLAIVKLCNTDTDASCATEDSHSYPTGTTQHFVVIVGISGTLQNATSPSSPLVTLRIRSQTGQSLDCDPGYTNLKQELASGCRPSYTINHGTPDCSTIGTSALWASAQPWNCIAVNTGRQPNDVADGLNTRIFQNNKPPNNDPGCALGLGHVHYNNWANFVDNGGDDGFPVGDPRILNAYITTYGAFSHVNGTSGSVPIIGFGHFYVTGYIGNGGGFDPPTNCGNDAVPNNDPGLIVGHFIRYIDKLGGTGTDPCDPNSINACVIVMTK